MNTEKAIQEKNILELIYLEKGIIRIYFYQSSQTGPARKRYQTEIAKKKIDEVVKKIKKELDRLNNFKTDPAHFTNLKKTCLYLYDELLNQEIKTAIQKTSLKNLELRMDDQLMHIPWEWLFDGEQFLCERFNIGRQIQVEVDSAPCAPSHINPLNMLIITDPTEDENLEMARREGDKIQALLGVGGEVIRPRLLSGDQIDTDFIRKHMRDYDLIHYAGHVDHVAMQPEKSGWVVSDGIFSGNDIEKMTCTQKPMPSLVFSNACKSAATGQRPRFLNGGLVESFLKAGVQYYIGTFCDTSDEYGLYMGKKFYYYLIKGHTVAESLRKARVSFQKRYGQESLSWLNYVFYGDPASYLIQPASIAEPAQKEKKVKGNNQKKGEDEKAIQNVGPPDDKKKPTRRFINPPKKLSGLKSLLIALIVLMCMGGLYFMVKNGTIGVKGDIHNRGLTQAERIEKLKEKIRAKLLQRAPYEGPSNKEKTKPFVIAVVNVFNEEEGSMPRWAGTLLENLTRKVVIHFTQDTHIELGERKALETLLEEMDLNLSVLPWDNPADASLFGKFLYARAMLFLDIYKESGGIFSPKEISLYYRLVDVETCVVKYAEDDLKLVKDASTPDLAEKVYHRIQRVIYDGYIYPEQE